MKTEQEFSLDTRGNEKSVSAHLEKKIQKEIAAGLNPALPKVARMLSNHDPDFRREYMLNLKPTGERQITEEEVDRAISTVDGSGLGSSSRKPKKGSPGVTKSQWPTPKKATEGQIKRSLKQLGISPAKETLNQLKRKLKKASPDGHGHSVEDFIRDAFYDMESPIYLGDRYSGGIVFPREFHADEQVVPVVPTHFLPNTMKRKLNQEEIDSGKHKSGGRKNRFANDRLEVITFESDLLEPTWQLVVIHFLAEHLPLCFVVSSGGKSYHATFSLKGLSRKEVDEVRQVFVNLGGDPALLKPVQLSRLGGAIRENSEKEQRVLFMDRKGRHRLPNLKKLRSLVSKVTSSTVGGEEDTRSSDEEAAHDTSEEAFSFPSIVSTSEDVTIEERDRRPIIDGLLRVGHKAIFSAPSKAGKTWAMINLALQVEAGGTWMGFECHRVPVLFLNFEILPDEFVKRVRLVQKASDFCGEIQVDFDILNLRDQPRSWEILTEYLKEACAKRDDEGVEPYGLIILDPIYKLLGDTDENSNGGVGLLLAALGRLASETRTAVIFSHHHSKGAKAHVPILDRMSGAGCWARDPDLIMDLTEHEEEDCYTVEAVPRSFKKPSAKVVRQRFPIFEEVDHLDPANLRKPGGSKKTHTIAKVTKCFEGCKKLSNVDLLRLLQDGGVGRTTAKKLIGEAEENRIIKTDKKRKGKTYYWRLVEDGQSDLVSGSK